MLKGFLNKYGSLSEAKSSGYLHDCKQKSLSENLKGFFNKYGSYRQNIEQGTSKVES